MVAISNSQFWWIVVSTVLIVLGSALPWACEQMYGSVNQLCRWGAAACLTVGFVGLVLSLCQGCGGGGWAMGILGAMMMLGAGLACVFGCHDDGGMPDWCSYLAIPALLGLVLLGMAAAANGSGGWYAAVAVLFVSVGCAMMKYQRNNAIVDGLGGPMVGMGWVLLAIAAAAE